MHHNYPDDNILYSADKNVNIVISRLRRNVAIMSEWFYENYMVLNAAKCYFLTVGFYEPFPDFSFNDTSIENVIEEKILGIVTDMLNFKSHLKIYVKKTHQNLCALSKISKLTTLNKPNKTR